MHALPHRDGWMLSAHPDPLLPRRLRDGLASGRVIRVRPGVYAAPDEWRALAAHERYTERVRAHTLVRPGDTLEFESAAVCLGLPIFGEPRDIHILLPPGSATRRRSGIVEHAGEIDRATITRDGVRVADVATTALDLARVLSPAYALAVIDAAIQRERRDRTTISDLRLLARRQARARNARQLTWLFAHASTLAESAGESVSRAVIGWLGFPAPQLQAEFPHREGIDRVDFWWRDASFVGESDGYLKYLSVAPDLAARRLIEEKRREDRIRARVRAFTRWTWADLFAGLTLRDRLVAAGLTPIAPPDHALLATLRRVRSVGH